MKKNSVWISVLASALVFLNAKAQEIKQEPSWTNNLTVKGYAELYYRYDFNQPKTGEIDSFLYSFNRQNEVNLNFGMAKLAYDKDRVRANLAFMAGTYVKSNMVNEPDGLKNIYEANIGIKVLADSELWLDVGVMPSHLGFESNIGADVMTMTRSIAAENSPYFSSGAKLSYLSPNSKWLLAATVMNGWQRIQRQEGNTTLAFGHQVTYTPNAKWSINSSSFVGSDTPDTTRQMRYFHNLYATFQLSSRTALLAGFDIGVQQKEKHSNAFNVWYSPVVTGQYKVSVKWRVSGRVEYFCDANQVIIATDTPNGFQTFGYSVNVDYQLTDAVLWRIEARNFSSKDNLFNRNNQAVASQFVLGSSLSIRL